MAKQESKGLDKLLEDQLKDLYYVEKQLVKALPKMAKAATNEELRACFEEHLAETKAQVTKLEDAFAAMGKKAQAKKCPAIDGILEEGTEHMEEYEGEPALDAALVASAQKVEHYEITSYGSACAWAEQLGLDEVKEILDEILNEEKSADEKLTEIGETVVNIEAETEEDEDEQEDQDKAPAKKSGKKTAAKSGTMAKSRR